MKAAYSINWLTNQFENGVDLTYLFFWGHTNKDQQPVGKFCLSQWYDCPFTVRNITYKTAEHWMMAHKALLFGSSDLFDKIVNSQTPAEAKELGRQLIGFDELVWDDHKYQIVIAGNIHKFNQHPEPATYLLNTGDKILVEASPADRVWGIGLAQDSVYIDNIYAWEGQNLLGFALMEVRDFLKTFRTFQYLENAPQPPWAKYPGIDAMDMFWRMGTGEDCIVDWTNYFQNLSPREQTIYQLTHPPPLEWQDFYD